MLIRLLGYFADFLFRARFRYLTMKNTSVVNTKPDSWVHIGASCQLRYPENIYVGENSYINGGVIVASPNAKIVIGSDCLISYNVHIRTDMHNYKDKNQLIRNQGHTEKDIIIGNDVWIGCGAQIMAGVTIADGCVIAAGAVVTHNTQEYGVYGGVPARLISMRTAISDDN